MLIKTVLTLATHNGGGRQFGSFSCFLRNSTESLEDWYAWNEYLICQEHNDCLLQLAFIPVLIYSLIFTILRA